MRILDGGTDARHQQLDLVGDDGSIQPALVDHTSKTPTGQLFSFEDEERYEWYDPQHERYKSQGTDTNVVTKSKLALVEAMEQIANMRANFRLGKLLYFFKELNSTQEGRTQLDIFNQCCATGQVSE